MKLIRVAAVSLALLVSATACGGKQPTPTASSAPEPVIVETSPAYVPPAPAPSPTTEAAQFAPVTSVTIEMASDDDAAKQDVRLIMGEPMKPQSLPYLTAADCTLGEDDLAIPFIVDITSRTAVNPVGVAFSMRIGSDDRYDNPTRLFLSAGTCHDVPLAAPDGFMTYESKHTILEIASGNVLADGQTKQYRGAVIVTNYYKGNEKPKYEALFVHVLPAEANDGTVYRAKSFSSGVAAWGEDRRWVAVPVDGKSNPCKKHDKLYCGK